MKWNKEEKHYYFTEGELTNSVKRNVFKLLQIPEICKIIDSRRIKKITYGYSLKSFWEQEMRCSAQNQLDKIITKCKELYIPYSNATVVKSGSNLDLWSWWIQIFVSEQDRVRYSERWLKKLNIKTENKKISIFQE
jgi:hypothetical protein